MPTFKGTTEALLYRNYYMVPSSHYHSQEVIRPGYGMLQSPQSLVYVRGNLISICFTTGIMSAPIENDAFVTADKRRRFSLSHAPGREIIPPGAV